jgi:hypothetical protein
MFRNQELTDSLSIQFSDTINSINNLSLLGGANINNDKYIILILILVAVLYMSVQNKSTSPKVLDHIDTPFVKVGVLGLIIFVGRENPIVAVAAITVFCLTIQSLQNRVPTKVVDVEEDIEEEVFDENNNITDEITDELDEIIQDEANNINALNNIVNKSESSVLSNIGSNLSTNDNVSSDGSSVEPVASDENLLADIIPEADDENQIVNNFDNQPNVNNMPNVPDQVNPNGDMDNEILGISDDDLSNLEMSELDNLPVDIPKQDSIESIPTNDQSNNFLSRMQQSVNNESSQNLSNQISQGVSDLVDDIQGIGSSDYDNFESFN